MDLKESIRELQNNETFKHILATLLAIGNFLNGKKVRASTIVTAIHILTIPSVTSVELGRSNRAILKRFVLLFKISK